MADQLISVNNVSKSYGKKEVLRNVNLAIHKGDSLAFIGHNGSGKSTLLRILAGLASFNSGQVQRNKKLKIHYIPEHFPKLALTAKEYVVHMGLIEGLNKSQAQAKSRQLFELFFMDNMQETPMKYLSKGTLQKVAVIQALLSNPALLLLDEPLSGQDIDSQNIFIQTMIDLKKQGTAIAMSCHEKVIISHISDLVYEIKDGIVKETSVMENNSEEIKEMHHEYGESNDAL